MRGITVRNMETSDRDGASELICLSHNTWYQLHAMTAAFGSIPESGEFFFDLYGTLEGSHGFIAENSITRQLAGLCFYQVRSSHVSVGMMSVHPNYFKRGVGKALLKSITDVADRKQKPLRLVSSALNLDSFSLYNRAGFIPRYAYQDMLVQVPDDGFRASVSRQKNIRSARESDILEMARLEQMINGMRREKDLHYLIENQHGRWHVSILEAEGGGIEGFIASCKHPDIHMLGPGIARNEEQLLSLITAELNQYRGHTVLQLVPVDCHKIVHILYGMGARNMELHFYQVRGAHTPFKGLYTPTYMFESG